MNRAAALKLVGQRVSAYTAMNGDYVGTLVRVTDDRPWRGVVIITGVLDPACLFERGHALRRGFRPGEELEVGGCNIRPTDKEGHATYLAALEAAERNFAASDGQWGRHEWVRAENLKQSRIAIEREKAGWPRRQTWTDQRSMSPSTPSDNIKTASGAEPTTSTTPATSSCT